MSNTHTFTISTDTAQSMIWLVFSEKGRAPHQRDMARIRQIADDVAHCHLFETVDEVLETVRNAIEDSGITGVAR